MVEIELLSPIGSRRATQSRVPVALGQLLEIPKEETLQPLGSLLLVFRGNLLCSSLCLRPLVLVLNTAENRLDLSSLQVSLQVFIDIDEIHLNHSSLSLPS